MERINNKNLIPLNKRTKAEQRELAVIGGKASGKVRKEKKMMKDLFKMVLALPLTSEDEMTAELKKRKIETTEQMAIVLSAIKKSRSDPSMFDKVLALIGEKPKEETHIDNEIKIIWDIPRPSKEKRQDNGDKG